MMSKMTGLRTFATLAAALVCACVVTGCSREAEKATETKSASAPESYMNDPVFTNALAKLSSVRSSIMGRYDAARKLYEAEQAKAPDSAKAKELKAAMLAIEEEFQANRRQTRQLVRERLLQVEKSKQQ